MKFFFLVILTDILSGKKIIVMLENRNITFWKVTSKAALSQRKWHLTPIVEMVACREPGRNKRKVQCCRCQVQSWWVWVAKSLWHRLSIRPSVATLESPNRNTLNKPPLRCPTLVMKYGDSLWGSIDHGTMTPHVRMTIIFDRHVWHPGHRLTVDINKIWDAFYFCKNSPTFEGKKKAKNSKKKSKNFDCVFSFGGNLLSIFQCLHNF